MTDNPEPALMTYRDLAAEIQGELLSFSAEEDPGFLGVAIDSREIGRRFLFAALPGSEADGHAFVKAAFAGGATGILAEQGKIRDPRFGILEAAEEAGGIVIAVEDTLRGLQAAAAAYLRRFPNLLRIAITGSSGKTGTKELAGAMIAGEKRVIMNRGNLNSETGLPLSVFEVRSFHEVGIFEMGMNHQGEIEALAKVLKPHIALITNIGTAHIGNIGSQLDILKEKRRIFQEFTGTETALIPQDDGFRDLLAENVRGKTIFYGPCNLEELGAIRDLGLEGAEILWEGVPVHFRLPGRHNIKNVLAAASIAKEVPVGPAAIRGGIAGVKPLFGRGEILRVTLRGAFGEGTATAVRDCYNANFEAMEEIINFCDSVDWPGRRLYVVGSMLELGERSEDLHRRLGEVLASSRADRVYLFGEETRAALGKNRKIPFFHTDTMNDLSRELRENLRPGDLVLLKGSRGCALERALEGLLEEDGTGAEGDF